MANRLLIYTILFVLLIAQGCSNKTLSPKHFSDYYEENKKDLLKTRTNDILEFEAQYVPTDVITLSYMDNRNEDFNPEQFGKNYSNYDSAYYFKFKIQAADKQTLKSLIKSKENLSVLNHYLLTEIQHDFSVEIGNKRIACGLINVESDIQMQSSFSFIMSFEKEAIRENLQDDITLIYNDNIFQNGILKFHFSKEQINNFPKIKAS